MTQTNTNSKFWVKKWEKTAEPFNCCKFVPLSKTSACAVENIALKVCVHGKSDMLEKHRVWKVKASAQLHGQTFFFRKEYAPCFNKCMENRSLHTLTHQGYGLQQSKKNFPWNLQYWVFAFTIYILMLSFITNEVIRRCFFICDGWYRRSQV